MLAHTLSHTGGVYEELLQAHFVPLQPSYPHFFPCVRHHILTAKTVPLFLPFSSLKKEAKETKQKHLLFWFSFFWWSHFSLKLQGSAFGGYFYANILSVPSERRELQKRKKKKIVCRPSVGAFHGRNGSLFLLFFLRDFVGFVPTPLQKKEYKVTLHTIILSFFYVIFYLLDSHSTLWYIVSLPVFWYCLHLWPLSSSI